ncbi:MAG: hypothetical protein LBG27_00465 [Spirochaetaceae bacterium]|jgi:hypothetical protein|nr:hypothetical protein [Spirochaetaceae bacterium]
MATGLAITSLVISAAGVGVSAASASKNAKIAKDQLDYQKQKDYTQMQGQIAEYQLGIEESRAQVDSYDKWLGNYQNMYDQQMASKNAQTEALKASGQEAYDNFMNAIGYSDALAGASGRVGGNTSAGAAAQAIDRQLVNYAGEDRSLSGYDGLFGAQLQAANLETDQIRKDLEFQLFETQQNRGVAEKSIEHYENAIERTQSAMDSLQSEAASKAAETAKAKENYNKIKKIGRSRRGVL